jgi:hypothetical protein
MRATKRCRQARLKPIITRKNLKLESAADGGGMRE